MLNKPPHTQCTHILYTRPRQKHIHTHTRHTYTVTQHVSLHTCNLSNRILSRNPFVLTTLLPTCSVMLWPSGSGGTRKPAMRLAGGEFWGHRTAQMHCHVSSLIRIPRTHTQEMPDLSPTFTSSRCGFLYAPLSHPPRPVVFITPLYTRPSLSSALLRPQLIRLISTSGSVQYISFVYY